MSVDWTEYFICSICNTSGRVVKVLEEGIDPDTKNPYQKMELECGHIQKRLRVSKEVTFRWNINKDDTIKVEPVIIDGKPSMAVSGGNHSTILPGPVNIGLEGAKNNTIFVNIRTVKSEGNSNFVQNLSNTDISITYNEILKQIDRDITDESERQEIKNILEEIKNDINSKRIPESGLQKLKPYENIYNAVLPWAMKGIDLIIKFGFVGS